MLVFNIKMKTVYCYGVHFFSVTFGTRILEQSTRRWGGDYIARGRNMPKENIGGERENTTLQVRHF